jgi:membrane-associated phospholipid phosphatase
MRPKKVLELQLSRAFAVIALLFSLGISVHASDQVLDWIQIMNDTVLAGGTSPLNSTRVVALVSSAVFDAVNGIERRYQPLLVAPDASKPASRRAAAIEAAYAVLVNQYPLQTTSLKAKRDAAVMALSGLESAKSIQNGINWGDTVANTIIADRSGDGFSPPAPPFEGVLGISQGVPGISLTPSAAIGIWRPTPTGATGGNAPGAGPQFASMTPWVMARPSQFRLPPPYATAMTAGATNVNALTTAAYATDYNEVKTYGVLSGQNLTNDQKQVALFWAGNTPLFWNRIASDLSTQRRLTLSQNARLFALLNVSMADAGIACWDSKYRYVFWRPITAIRSGDLDNNPATDPDPAWQPFLDSHPVAADRGTPAHPEYPSGHSTVSGAAAFVLAAAFGENTEFSVGSEALPQPPGSPPARRTFSSFTQATDEIADARVFGGIHYRSSCVRGNALGRAVAEYVSTHSFVRKDEDRDDE